MKTYYRSSIYLLQFMTTGKKPLGKFGIKTLANSDGMHRYRISLQTVMDIDGNQEIRSKLSFNSIKHFLCNISF